MTASTHTFICAECRRSFTVDDGMREALLASGCAVCGAPVGDSDILSQAVTE